jgi:predicted nuclease of restriction endonuclease-like (RecB) superfamily
LDDSNLENKTTAGEAVTATELIRLDALHAEVRALIVAARQRVGLYVNQELTLLYWDVGQRVRSEILRDQRADYGKAMVDHLVVSLSQEFGSGFGRRNLFNMIRFAEVFANRQIVQTVSAQLSWSHFVEILPLNEPLKREFYTELARVHHWSVRTLRDRIRSMLFERTALSRKPDDLIQQEIALLRDKDQLTPDMVLRDPYLLPFLGLADTYREKDLEDAIIREMEAFLLEVGDGFTFAARQKAIPVGTKTYSLDLLLYHRKLRRLVAIELKVGPFQPEYKGQMELYLSWLNRNEREPHEEAPIGLILCSEAQPEEIALLGLEQGDIRVARYLTETLPPTLLEAKLRDIIRQQREYLARRQGLLPDAGNGPLAAPEIDTAGPESPDA